MSNAPSGEPPVDPADELLPEYQFDYRKARPNRFASSNPPGGRLVVLEPDIARVFTTAESVNSVPRALISTMPPVASRSHDPIELQRFTVEWPTVEEKGDWLPALAKALESEKTTWAGCLSPFSGRHTGVNRCSPIAFSHSADKPSKTSSLRRWPFPRS